MTLSVKIIKMEVKNVDIMYKVVSLQCSCIKQLYKNNSLDWKVIPLHMITQKLGKKFFISF